MFAEFKSMCIFVMSVRHKTKNNRYEQGLQTSD